jgi:hypothetical protein
VKQELPPTALPAEKMSSAPPEGCPFKVGDLVKFTNDYEVEFGPHMVMGFTLPGDELHGRNVYLNTSCYWFPKHVGSLTPWEDSMGDISPG